MSARGMTLTLLANGLARAVAEDEKEIKDGHPDCGFDLSAGMFGAHVSSWMREVAEALSSAATTTPNCTNLRIAIRACAIRAGVLRNNAPMSDEELILLLNHVGDLAHAAQERLRG